MPSGRPSNSVIAGGAVALLGFVLTAIAIQKLMSTGTCSSTGYTQYGPAPHCPKGTGWYGGFLAVGIILSVVAGGFVGWSFANAGLFVAIGTGSVLVAFSHHPTVGVVFPAVFGGCFAAGGLIWGAYAWNGRPIKPRPSPTPAPAVPVIAGLGPAAESTGPRLPRIGVRPVVAAVVWVAAVAGAIELGAVVSRSARSTKPAGASIGSEPRVRRTIARPVDITRARLPRPAGSVAAVGPASAVSMFRRENLARALDELTRRFGLDGSVVALAIYPGQLDAVMAEGGNARLVTAAPTGALQVGAPVPFAGSRQAVDVSQLHADVPGRLARQIEARGGVPTARLDRFVLDLGGTLAHWRIYPARGDAHFQAFLTGDGLERVSARGTQPIN